MEKFILVFNQIQALERKRDFFVCFGTSGSTVLPTKSGSDVVFCLQSYQGLTIDRSLVYLSYPHRFALAEVECTS